MRRARNIRQVDCVLRLWPIAFVVVLWCSGCATTWRRTSIESLKIDGAFLLAQIDTWDAVWPVMSGQYEKDHRSFVVVYRLPQIGPATLHPIAFHEVTLGSERRRSKMKLPPTFVIGNAGAIVRFWADASGSSVHWDKFGLDGLGSWKILSSGAAPVELAGRGRLPVWNGGGYWFISGSTPLVLNIEFPERTAPGVLQQMIAAAAKDDESNTTYALTRDAEFVVARPLEGLVRWYGRESRRGVLPDIPSADLVATERIEGGLAFLVRGQEVRGPPFPSLIKDRHHLSYAVLDERGQAIDRFKMRIGVELERFLRAHPNDYDLEESWDPVSRRLLYYIPLSSAERSLPVSVELYRDQTVLDFTLDVSAIPGRQ